MKLIYEESLDVKGIVEEELNESTGKSNKSYYIQGVFSTIGEKNRNGRIYPRNIWEREVNRYQEEIKCNSITSLMEWEHPERSTVDPMAAVAKIVDIKIDGKYILGKAKLLNNDKANQLKSLIDEGIAIGVSSRGVGKVGANGIVEDFKLVNWDTVSAPSDFAANTKGLTESWNNGILQSKNYELDTEGNIVEICGTKSCSKFKKEDIKEAIIYKMNSLFSEVNETFIKNKEHDIQISTTKFQTELSKLRDMLKQLQLSNTEYSKLEKQLHKIEASK